MGVAIIAVHDTYRHERFLQNLIMKMKFSSCATRSEDKRTTLLYERFLYSSLFLWKWTRHEIRWCSWLRRTWIRSRHLYWGTRYDVESFFIYKWEQLLKWYPYEFHATSWNISKDIMIIIETFVSYCCQDERLSRYPNASNPIQLNLWRQYHDVVKTSDK